MANEDAVDVVIAYSDTTSEIGTVKTVPRAKAQAWCADGRARIASKADKQKAKPSSPRSEKTSAPRRAPAEQPTPPVPSAGPEQKG